MFCVFGVGVGAPSSVRVRERRAWIGFQEASRCSPSEAAGRARRFRRRARRKTKRKTHQLEVVGGLFEELGRLLVLVAEPPERLELLLGLREQVLALGREVGHRFLLLFKEGSLLLVSRARPPPPARRDEVTPRVRSRVRALTRVQQKKRGERPQETFGLGNRRRERVSERRRRVSSRERDDWRAVACVWVSEKSGGKEEQKVFVFCALIDGARRPLFLPPTPPPPPKRRSIDKKRVLPLSQPHTSHHTNKRPTQSPQWRTHERRR